MSTLNCSNREQSLLETDLYRYDEAWEKVPTRALQDYFNIAEELIDDLISIASKLSSNELDKIPVQPNSCIIDLRKAEDYNTFHLPTSVNLPLVTEDSPNPFTDATALGFLWGRFEALFANPSKDLLSLIENKKILLLCYDGDSARVATSVLRAKGYQADSLRGGFQALGEMNQNRPDTPVDEANLKQLLGQSKSILV